MRDLYIDFDGVILDTIRVTYEMLEQKKIALSERERVKNFYKKLDWYQLLKETPQINDSINSIQKIIDSEKYNVIILTHINSLQEAVEKVHYIRKYFKDVTFIPVPREISKTKMVHTKGAVLIDDFPGNLEEWEQEGGVAIRFCEKLNGKGYRVIDRLDKILMLEIS